MEIVGKAKEDVSLPKATMTKIIKEMLPAHVRVTRDAQDLLVECCVEFINLISSESNDICYKEEKRTIAPEHVLESLKAGSDTILWSIFIEIPVLTHLGCSSPSRNNEGIILATIARIGSIMFFRTVHLGRVIRYGFRKRLWYKIVRSHSFSLVTLAVS